MLYARALAAKCCRHHGDGSVETSVEAGGQNTAWLAEQSRAERKELGNEFSCYNAQPLHDVKSLLR